MKSFIPNKIYYILIAILIVIILSFCFYFGIEKFSLKDVSLSLFVNILSIIISLFVVDRLIKKYEKKKWCELDKRIKERLVNFLIFAYNIVFLHIGRAEEWAEINRSDKIKEIKIAEYVDLLKEPKINEKYLKTVIEDTYLNKWYSDGYDGIHKLNETLFQDFQNRLDYNQLPIILDLKTLLSNISTNLRLYHNLDEIFKSEGLVVTVDRVSDIKNDLVKIISLTNNLAKTII